MGSTRLPGKVLRDLGGRTVLGWVVRAVREAAAVDDLVVATTTRGGRRRGGGRVPAGSACPATGGRSTTCSPGSCRCSRRHPGDAVMRFTADCPLLDPAMIREAALVFRAVPGLDYLSTGLARTLPRGLDVEIVRPGRAAPGRPGGHRAPPHARHLLPLHAPGGVAAARPGLPAGGRPDLRVTLDTEEDWRLISRGRRGAG